MNEVECDTHRNICAALEMVHTPAGCVNKFLAPDFVGGYRRDFH
jgi:hypothetical protein